MGKLIQSEFTPLEQRFLNLLSDGNYHHKSEFYTLFNDEQQQCPDKAVSRVITHLRKKLAPKSQNIVCVMRYWRTYYLQVRMLNDPYEE